MGLFDNLKKNLSEDTNICDKDIKEVEKMLEEKAAASKDNTAKIQEQDFENNDKTNRIESYQKRIDSLQNEIECVLKYKPGIFKNDYAEYCDIFRLESILIYEVLIDVLEEIIDNGDDKYFDIDVKTTSDELKNGYSAYVVKCIDLSCKCIEKENKIKERREKYFELIENYFNFIEDNPYNVFNSKLIAYGNQCLISLAEKNNYRIDKRLEKTENEISEIFDFDSLDGVEFEEYCTQLLKNNGFSDIKNTKITGDMGVDIIAIKDDIKYAIQCKCWDSDLGNGPIQEVFTGKVYYDCDIAVVMTNRFFTKGAKQLAQKNRVKLWDRNVLIEMINK